MRKSINPVVAIIVIVVVLVLAWFLLSKLTGSEKATMQGGQLVDADGNPIRQGGAVPGPRNLKRGLSRQGGQAPAVPGG